jgi:hypothetical protein
MAKDDPAFLFYSKEWLSKTAEMLPEEKGVFIDLLAYQHQLGSLPNDTKRLAKLVRLSEAEFLPIWETFKSKFKDSDNRLVNLMLDGLMTERSEKGLRNGITGTLASVIRLSKEPREIKEKIKQSFKIDEFLDCPKEKLTERLTEWFQSRLKSIGNGNGNNISSISNSESNIVKALELNVSESELQMLLFGMFEYQLDETKTKEMYIVQAMMRIWVENNPEDYIDKQKDFPALLDLAYKIAAHKHWTRDSILNENYEKCKDSWGKIVVFLKNDDFYYKFPIHNLPNNFSGIIKKMNNAKPVKSSSTSRDKQNAASAAVSDDIQATLTMLQRRGS